MFTDKMTVLVEPSKAIVTNGVRPAGTYIWEKAQTLKLVTRTAQVRVIAGQPMDPFIGFEGTEDKTSVWYENNMGGMTVRNGKLRFWLKNGSKFFSFQNPTQFADKEMDSHIQGFLDRHNFARKSDDAIENLTWAYAPAACETFGTKLVQHAGEKMNEDIPFSVIKGGCIKTLVDHLKINANLQGLADKAVAAQDYGALRTIMIASQHHFEGDIEGVLDMPFKASEIPDQRFSSYRMKNLPAAVLPMAIRTFDTESGKWYTINREAYLVPFRAGDDPEVWATAVLTRSEIIAAERRALYAVQYEARKIKEAGFDLMKIREQLSHLSTATINSDLTKWQEEGLMDQDNRGILVWKAVSRDLKGHMGCPYTMDEEFQNGGMAAVGPWGAVKDYGHQDSYVLALRITEGGPVDTERRPGVWYATKGTPVAQYLITELTEDGFVPVLLSGTDEMAILTGVPSKKNIQVAVGGCSICRVCGKSYVADPRCVCGEDPFADR